MNIDNSIPPIQSLDDMSEEHDAHSRRMDGAFRHDSVKETMLLNIAYPYEIDLSEIMTPADLLGWTRHLCEKGWMDNVLLAEFIDRVGRVKGWTSLLHSGN